MCTGVMTNDHAPLKQPVLIANVHKGNTEEAQNGYVVFKRISWKRLGSEGWGGVILPAPTPFYSSVLDRYLNTT